MFRRGSIFDDMEWEIEQTMRDFDRFFRQARDWARTAPTGGPLVYGWTVNVGPDGVPHVEHFGNVPTQQALEEGVREPFISTSVDEEKNLVHITAEMPGVDKRAIKVSATEDTVSLEAQGEQRKYARTIRLALPVVPDSAKARYNNGVLDLTLELAKPIKPKGREIRVE